MLQHPQDYSDLPAEKTDASKQAWRNIPRVEHPNANVNLSLKIFLSVIHFLIKP
jgi:hypothetical protein